MKLTFKQRRGYHYWYCLVCGRAGRDRIPDQAHWSYYHNPNDPYPGICPECDRKLERKEVR